MISDRCGSAGFTVNQGGSWSQCAVSGLDVGLIVSVLFRCVCFSRLIGSSSAVALDRCRGWEVRSILCLPPRLNQR